jgi:5-methylcytosine-specific restriction endonuclease McrA
MSSAYISEEIRQLVSARAEFLCEYCLIHETDTFVGCQVDHIISEKHGGATELENLAFACAWCNRNKGSDIASLARDTGQLVRLFNPRTDRWNEHLQLVGSRIEADSDWRSNREAA